MPYLSCGRCGLQIKIQAAYLRIANCPRCLARTAMIAPMTLSANGVRHAGACGARAVDHRAGRGERFPETRVEQIDRP